MCPPHPEARSPPALPCPALPALTLPFPCPSAQPCVRARAPERRGAGMGAGPPGTSASPGSGPGPAPAGPTPVLGPPPLLSPLSPPPGTYKSKDPPWRCDHFFLTSRRATTDYASSMRTMVSGAGGAGRGASSPKQQCDRVCPVQLDVPIIRVHQELTRRVTTVDLLPSDFPPTATNKSARSSQHVLSS